MQVAIVVRCYTHHCLWGCQQIVCNENAIRAYIHTHKREATAVNVKGQGLLGVERYLQASASLRKVGVTVDPVHAVHVNSKPAWQNLSHP